MKIHIRPEAIKTLVEPYLVRRLVRSFRSQFTFSGREVPSELTQYRMEKIAKHCIKVARSKGFESERGIATFALHMFTIHPLFHTHEALDAILGDTRISEVVRLRRILEDCSDEEWNEAAAMGDVSTYWDRVVPLERSPE